MLRPRAWPSEAAVDLLGQLGRFDHVLLDIYGVLHDGRRAYRDAAPFLDALRAHALPFSLVSNSPWTGARTRSYLQAFRLDLSGVHAVLTAGDVARRWIDRSGLSSVCYVGRPQSRDLIQGLDQIYAPPGEADCVLFAGGPEYVEAAVRAADGKPLVCVDPTADHPLLEAYAEAGGTVVEAAKPDPAIFRMALDDQPAAHPVVVGDSPSTDLAGARRADLPAIWLDRHERSDRPAVVAAHRPYAVVDRLV